MSVAVRVQEDLKTAMKAKDPVGLRTLRSLLAAFKNAEVAGKGVPTEEDYMALIKKQAKQRKESIAQFVAAGREDLAQGEREELAVINTYLPAQMSREELEALVAHTAAQLDITGPSDMGKLMGQVMAACKDTADGGMVREVVQAYLAQL